MKKGKLMKGMAVVIGIVSAVSLAGCKQQSASSGGKVEVEMVSYKPEAVDTFEKIEKHFNETHDNIHLTINSPNEAMTILKTRFIREDYPDIIAIGGDINYSNFLDADLFMDISDLDVLKNVKKSYLDIDKQLEFIPQEGRYALPYVANAAGILYNKDMFDQHGWKIPNTWDEFIALCDTIKASGAQPLYLGYKDTWTCLAPWNALAVGLTAPDICNQVNMGKTTLPRPIERLQRRKESCLITQSQIHMPTPIMMLVLPLPEAKLQCFQLAVMPSRRLSPSIQI